MIMNIRKSITLSVILISGTLSSCIVPNSADPVGDSFKRTGDAIGKVVNGMTGQPQVGQPQQHRDPRPYQPQQHQLPPQYRQNLPR